MNYKGKRTKGDLIKSIVPDALLPSVRKIYNNTLKYDLSEGGFGIQLHDTEILRSIGNNGTTIILSSGGHKTLTTKTRLNDWLAELETGFHLYQDKGVWYISRSPYWVNNRPTDDIFVFQDDIALVYNFDKKQWDVTNHGGDPKKIKILQKNILQYAKDYAQAFVDGDIPAPSGGDCWGCYLQTTDGESLGEVTNSTDHLDFHLDEKYYVPSLLVSAIKHYPVSEFCKMVIAGKWQDDVDDFACTNSDWSNGIAQEQIQSSIKRYLRSQYGLAQ